LGLGYFRFTAIKGTGSSTQGSFAFCSLTHTMSPQALGKGIYVPIPTFFKDNEDLDLETLEKHLTFLSNTGLAGIIFMGSTGEAIHLTDEERIAMIETGKKVLSKTDPSLKIIAGAGAPSARGTIKLCKDAAQAGADYVMVLPPSYYLNRINHESLTAFFNKVGDESPIPVIIYNYPGVCQGVDIKVDLLSELSRHPNIVGVKGTDGNIGKVGYLAEHTNASEFTLLAGSCDFHLPALTVGAVGCVPGLGNIAPSAIVKVQQLFEEGKLQEASTLQKKLVKPDDALNRWYGLSGLKGGMDEVLGYGGPLRNPLQRLSKKESQIVAEGLQPAWEVEQQLRREAGSQ
jgi:dihydrodipicolinate synthase/N-acetylneuraminate lyase